MAHRVAVRSDAQILEVQHYNCVNAEEAHTAATLAARFVRRFKLHSILVDLGDATIVMTHAESIAFENSLSKTIPHGVRIAVTGADDTWPAADGAFRKAMAAHSRGLYRAFPDREHALAWLEHPELEKAS